jgi:ubiquinone/menaquinone biosynthesis C-methylase UbiE
MQPIYEAIFERFQRDGLHRLLDSGCGCGDGCRLAKKRGFEPVGVDPASALLAVAKRENPELEFKQAVIEALPFDDGDFDAASAVNSFHLSPKMPQGARELFRVLRSGGMAAIGSVGPRESFQSERVYRALLSFVPKEHKCEHRFVDPFRASNSGVVDMLLEDAGFEVVGQTFVDQSVTFDEAEEFREAFSRARLYKAVCEIAGKDAVDAAILKIARDFRQPSGSIFVRDDARIVFARKP